MSDTQQFEPRFAEQLRSYAVAGAPTLARDQVARAVAAGVASRSRPRITMPWMRTGAQRRTTLPQLAAAAFILLIAAIGFAIWVGGNNAVIPPGGTPLPSATPSPSPSLQPTPALASITASVTPIPTGDVGPPASGRGTLRWSKLDAQALGLVAHPWGSEAVTRVAWVDDRFVLVDQAQRAIKTSIDGLTWEIPEEGSRDLDYYEPMALGSIASWRDEVIGWGATEPNILSTVQPPNGAKTHEFEGSIGAAGVGQAGIVVATHSALDFDRYITSLMGPGWVDHMTSFSFTDGVLRITANDRPELNLVWADQGFEPGDVADRGFGWLSLNGEDWTSIPDFPDNVSSIAAVENGFIASGSSSWYSADGLAWRRIGTYSNTGLLPWMGGVLTALGDSNMAQFDLWTSEGAQGLPVAGELDVGSRTIGAGPMGMVSFQQDGMILYSQDGSDWSLSPMPEEMAVDVATRGRVPTVAVGERSVVVLVWRWEADESFTPSLWLGTIEPEPQN